MNNIIKIDILAETGLLYEINSQVLNPHGLALVRNVGTISVIDRLVRVDPVAAYDTEAVKRNEIKLKDFHSDRNKYIDKNSTINAPMGMLLDKIYDILHHSITSEDNVNVDNSKNALLLMGVNEDELDIYIASKKKSYK